MQQNSCDARSYANNPPLRFHKLGDVDAPMSDSEADAKPGGD
jgi:hypothetical protein